MGDTQAVPPLYQRYSDSGHRRANRAGVQAALKPGDDAAGDAVTWLVRADTLGALGAPRAEYDVMRDVHGNWWLVKEVGALADGVYPLACERWEGHE